MYAWAIPFLHKFPTIKEYDQLHQLAVSGLITIGLIGSATSIAIQFFVHKNKVLHKKPD
jgi:preprotein translocase subunit Sss1